MTDSTKPGPAAERLNIDQPEWEKAVEKALKKPRPEEGWPDHHGRKKQHPSED